MRKQYSWKFLREFDGKIKSDSGDCEWKIGKLKIHTGDVVLCHSGFHCSKKVYQAFSYVQGEILAKVEVSGKSGVEKDKEVWQKMKIVKAYRWSKKDSIELAIYSAKQVLKYYEEKYPDDDRPRKAIEAAVKYVKNPTEENRRAAGAAGAAEAAARAAAGAAWAARAARAAAWAAEAAEAAEAAWAAAGAAEAAAGAAEAAARAAAGAAAGAAEAAEAAWAAAGAAAWAAEAAAGAAAGAAEAAAGAAMISKIARWMDRRVKSLEEIK